MQRYGREVNGGAELHCKLVAERLAAREEISAVTVLTTCAKEYSTWANHYAPGVEHIEGVRVERFAAPFERVKYAQSLLAALTMHGPHPTALEKLWLITQGPIVPGLLWRLDSLAHDHDAVIFFTYLYFPTVAGITRVPKEKRVLVPTAHDEPPIRLRLFDEVFAAPAAIAFNTTAERDFVAQRFGPIAAQHDIVGCGVDVARGQGPPARHKPFVLYIGRVAKNKGVHEAARAFARFKKRHAGATARRADGSVYNIDDLDLVIAGRGDMDLLPDDPSIIAEGFVAIERKSALLRDCEVMLMPSRFESLSLVMLEAWTLRRAILVQRACNVTAAHIAICGGGLTYRDDDEFGRRLLRMLQDPAERAAMGDRGMAYVAENYAWRRVEDKWIALLRALNN